MRANAASDVKSRPGRVKRQLPASPRFAAFLGTLDDSDILPAAIDHLRAIGVGTIVVTDFGSTDGSLDLLKDAEASGDIWLFEPSRHGSRAIWSPMRVKLAQSLGVDRVLFLDADELWLPAAGTLQKSADAREHDVLHVMRFNVAIGEAGPLMPDEMTLARYKDVLVHAQPVADPYGHMEIHPDAAWTEGHLESKVMVRPEAMTALHRAAHDVDLTEGSDWRRAIATDVVVAHVPFRSFEQFERKARNVTAAIDSAPHMFQGRQGWQWVRWARLLKEGRLREEWERQIVPTDRLATMRASHDLRSVAEILDRAIPPYETGSDYRAATTRSQPWLSAAAIACKREGVAPTSWSGILPDGRFPTVRVDGDHVVKLFGPWAGGRRAAAGEVAALRVTAHDPDLFTPRLIGRGRIDPDWEYHVLASVPGVPFAEVRDRLAPGEDVQTATWTGQLMRRMQDLPVDRRVAKPSAARFWRAIAKRRERLPRTLSAGDVLPPSLIAGLEPWLPTVTELRMGLSDPVLIHAAIDDRHILGYLDDDRFFPAGVTDFYGACMGHPMYELGPVWQGMARGQRPLIGAFLAAASLPGSLEPGFPRLALAWCLLHPHLTRRRLETPGIEDAVSLEELAERSFGSLG